MYRLPDQEEDNEFPDFGPGVEVEAAGTSESVPEYAPSSGYEVNISESSTRHRKEGETLI